MNNLFRPYILLNKNFPFRHYENITISSEQRNDQLPGVLNWERRTKSMKDLLTRFYDKSFSKVQMPDKAKSIEKGTKGISYKSPERPLQR